MTERRDPMPIKISITGDLGSGKSTVCKYLNEKYGLEVYSTGAIQRKIAVDMGMSTFDLNKYMESHPELDKKIDGALERLSGSENDIAIDSRMAWHFVRDTYKVFLTADETVAARRVIADKRGPSEEYADIAVAKAQLKARKASENLRFMEKYGVNCNDFRNYDLIVDTTEASAEKAADLIMARYAVWDKSAERPAFWISRFCLYPTRGARDLSAEMVDKYYGMIERGVPVPAVKILLSDGLFFISDGRHRAAAFCKAGKLLIPCALAAEQNTEARFDPEKAREWEEYNGFRYFSLPI